MRRSFRIPPEIRQRFMGALPLLVVPLFFIILHVIPFTGGALRNIESGIAAFSTRLLVAVRFVFSSSSTLQTESMACAEDRTRLAALAAGRDAPERAGEVSVLARGYAGDVYMVVLSRPEVPLSAGDALVAQGALVGLVAGVESDSASARLLSHEESKIPVTVQGKERTVGIAAGTGGAWLDLLYVPKDADLAVGDLLVTSGLGGLTPRDIPVGVVREVLQEDASPFLEARIAPLIDPDTWWQADVRHNAAL